ncbi:hypothetical protein AB4427_01360 [Vibrio artabrorum]
MSLVEVRGADSPSREVLRIVIAFARARTFTIIEMASESIDKLIGR